MRVTLSWPSRTLSPNGRAHHITKWRAKKAQEHEAWGATMAAASPDDRDALAAHGALSVALTFHPKTANRVDADNAVASLKAALDGIARALGVDDSLFRLAAPVMAEPRKGGAVIIEISPASAGPSDSAPRPSPQVHPGARDTSFLEGPTQAGAAYNPPSEMIAMGFPVPKGGEK